MLFPTATTIKKLNIRPIKKRGQNFLIDKNIASAVVEHAEITPSDTVLEIGTGLGALTYFLAEKDVSIFSVEIDRELFQCVRDSVPPDSRLSLINEDILRVQFSSVGKCDKNIIVVGSIPYTITSPIILKLLREASCIKHAVLVIQKEVAQRLCSGPGTRDYGILSVYCRAYAETSLYRFIPSGCFYPKPKVESAIIKLVPQESRRWDDPEEAFFRTIVKTSFSRRRKTLLNCLKGLLNQNNINVDQLKNELADDNIDLGRRSETLSIEEFDRLTAHIKKHM